MKITELLSRMLLLSGAARKVTKENLEVRDREWSVRLYGEIIRKLKRCIINHTDE